MDPVARIHARQIVTSEEVGGIDGQYPGFVKRAEAEQLEADEIAEQIAHVLVAPRLERTLDDEKAKVLGLARSINRAGNLRLIRLWRTRALSFIGMPMARTSDLSVRSPGRTLWA